MPETQNFVDVLSRLYEGIPLTISASSDFQFSSTLSASQELAANQPNANNYGFYWDGKVINFQFEFIVVIDDSFFSFPFTVFRKCAPK